MNWMDYDLYLFDLDDTLINTRPAVYAAWQATLANEVLPVESERALKILEAVGLQFGTMSDEEYWQAFAVEATGEMLNPHPLAQKLGQHYQRFYWQGLQPLPGAIDFLERLRQQGKKLGMATNGFFEFQFKKICHTGLDSFFESETIACIDPSQIHKRKPAPYMMHHLMQKLETSPQKTIYFGNALADILAGRLADVTTVAVCPIPNPGQLRIQTPHHTITSWDECR